MLSLFLLSLSLALDAMTVSVSVGIANPGGGWKQALRLGAWFGGFQFLMPLLGGLLGGLLSDYLPAAAPWVSFAILAILGGRMIWDGVQPQEKKQDYRDLSRKTLLLLAIATSIDALAAGVSITSLGLSPLFSAAVIGLTAFVLSSAGTLLGKAFGKLFRRCSQVVGGVVLIVIAVHALLSHL